MIKRLVWGFSGLFCSDSLFFFSPSISSCLDNVCFYRCLRTSNSGFQMEERILSFQSGTRLGPIVTWNNVPLLTLLSLESDIGNWYLSILSLTWIRRVPTVFPHVWKWVKWDSHFWQKRHSSFKTIAIIYILFLCV